MTATAEPTAAIIPLAAADTDPLARLILPAPRPWHPTANPAAAYLATLADGASRISMRSTLDKIAQIAGAADATAFAWARLRAVHTLALRARLVEQYAPATANKALAALRGTLKAAWRLEQITTDQFMRAADLPAVKGSRLPAGRAISAGGGAIALFAAFALMYGAGLRRAEVSALKLADYDPSTGEITLVGKGNKERKVYAINGGADALDTWIAHRGTHPGPLLQPVNKSGDINTAHGITSQALMYRLKKRCQEAAIAACSPHDLRRSFVSDLLDAGADISAVQTLAGHASTDTTARYDRRGEKTARKTAQMIHVPYTPPASIGRLGRRERPQPDRPAARRSGRVAR